MMHPPIAQRARILELATLPPTPLLNGRVQAARQLSDLVQTCVIPEPDDLAASCWLWKGGLSTPSRPGQSTPTAWYHVEQRAIPAARLAWMLAGLPIPPGHLVMRYRPRCDNPLCINPLHAVTGSLTESLRQRKGWKPPKEFGERLRAKTERSTTPLEKVRAIEADLDAGEPRRVVAKRHGVSVGTVQNIRAGKHPHSSRKARPASVFTWEPGGRPLRKDETEAPAANDDQASSPWAILGARA